MPTGGSTTTQESTTATTRPTTTSTATSPCGGEFSEDGELLSASTTGDARRISTLRTEQDNGCEEFVIGLTTDSGAPATSVGNLNVEFKRDLGVVRISFPTITETSITDVLLESPFIDRAYVVRGDDGSLFVDALLSAPAVARAEIVQSPARVVIVLESGGPALSQPAVTGESVVVLSPRAGDITYPIQVAGYVRSTVRTIPVDLLEEDQVIDQQRATVADGGDTWGTFGATIESGPSGDLRVAVGQDVSIDITVR